MLRWAERLSSTRRSGYEELLADASYRGEILVSTYPLVGNYGVCDLASISSTPSYAAMRLSIPKASLGNWGRAARDGKLAEVGKGQRLPSELEMELARARKELAEVRMERDLLKKFAAYFAKESR